jgi:DNA (cytosine-5)-methyltransferase 1
VRLVDEIRPRFFLMENVRGLLSAPIRHRPHAQRGRGYPSLAEDERPGSALRLLLDAFKAVGYSVSYALLQAADYGVPQIRERVFFFGAREGSPPPFPPPTHDRDGRDGLPHWRTLRDALAGLDDPAPEYVAYSETRLRYLRLLGPGQNWRDLPADVRREAMGGAYFAGGGKCGFYRRLSWDEPSPTVTTAPHQKATDMCHPDELRPLSVRECARVQTFPDDWTFAGSTVAKYRQVGNAVPPLLAYAVALQLAKALRGEVLAVPEAPRQLGLPLSAAAD